MLFPQTLRRQPQWLVLLEGLVLVGLIGWFDYATGWEWSFFAPFAVPIALVTWKTGRRLGLAFAVLCAIAFWVAHIGANPYRTGLGFGASVFGRWFYFSILAVAVAALKAKWELDRARIGTFERTQELEREILAIADQEKERLGRELHDGVCQTLAGISALSSTLSRKLAASPEAAASGDAAEITKYLHEAIRGTRELARGLDPVGLDEIGLDGALEALTVSVQVLVSRLVHARV